MMIGIFSLSCSPAVNAMMFPWAWSGAHSKEYYEQATEWERQKQELAAKEEFRHKQEITDQMGYELWMSAADTSRQNIENKESGRSSTGGSYRYTSRSRVKKDKVDTFLSTVLGVYSYFADRNTSRKSTKTNKTSQSATIKLKDVEYSKQGFKYYQQKNYDQAIVQYTQAINVKPDNAYYWEMRAGSYLGKKEYQKAIADYNQMVALKPEVFSYFERGHAYFEAGDYDKAIADFTQALALKPDDITSLRMRGLTYEQKKDYQNAEQDYKRVMSLKPDDTGIQKSLERIKEKKNNASSATTAVSPAVQIAPITPKAESSTLTVDDYSNLAFAYYQKEDYDNAIVNYTQAIKLEPEDDYYWEMRAESYRNKKDYPHAIADHNKVIQLAPDSYNYFERGITYYEAENYDAAIADFTQALNLESDDVTSLTMRSLAYEQKKDYQQVAADCKRILKLKPNDANATEILERVEQKMK